MGKREDICSRSSQPGTREDRMNSYIMMWTCRHFAQNIAEHGEGCLIPYHRQHLPHAGSLCHGFKWRQRIKFPGAEGGLSGGCGKEKIVHEKEPQEACFPFLSLRCGGWIPAVQGHCTCGQIPAQLLTTLPPTILQITLRILDVRVGKENLPYATLFCR